jgi:SAM-dependent methyltransferase
MDDVQEIDVEEIMEQIREKIWMHQQQFSHSDTSGLLSECPIADDLACLQSNYDIYHIPFTSHRKTMGRFVVMAKQILRKLLTPILERQLTYNTANARVASYLCAQLEETPVRKAAALQALRTEVAKQQAASIGALRQMMAEEVQGIGQQQTAAFQAVREAIAEQVGGLGQQQTAALQGLRQVLFSSLEQRAHDLRDSIISLVEAQQEHLSRLEGILAERDARMIELERANLRLQTHLHMQERRLGIFLEEARRRLPEPFSREQLQVLNEEEQHTLDGLYVSFEDRFRGSRKDIKERLQVYLPILEEAKLRIDDRGILDVGCGRGEWLELLNEQGFRGQGVDVNRVVIEQCRQQGLEVVESDALAYMQSLPDNSLGAVTGFHIIEHLAFDVMIKLFDETVRVLKPGGVAIFETPNPENILVGSYAFYLDPTHRNPLPSPIIRFLGEARGLCRVEIMNLNPLPEAFRVEEAGLEVAERFNYYFYGPQDYAMVGWKA